MPKPFRTPGKSDLIRVPDLLKDALMVLVRQIDGDRDPSEALYWLIWMMKMRGIPPDLGDPKVVNGLLRKKGEFFMRVDNYSLVVPSASESSEGYAALRMINGKCPFQLRMTNHSGKKTMAIVNIHGIHQGTWVLAPYQTMTIDRPAHIAELFHAYALGSPDANAIGLKDGDPNNGLVSVTFAPELKSQVILDSFSLEEAPVECGISFTGASRSFGAAGVGTEGKSSQVFSTTSSFETDQNETVTIHLRIVEDKDQSGPKPLSSASGRQNPIPRSI